MGAPIYDYNNNVVASIGINLLESNELTDKKLEEYKKIIREKLKKFQKVWVHLNKYK